MKEKTKALIDNLSMAELKKKDSYTLQQEAIELNRATHTSIVELGKRLIVLKEQCLKHSEYMKFIKEKLHLDYNIANKYVKLVKRYGIVEDNKNSELVTRLGVKKAIKLLKITDLQERLAFIKEHNLVEKSYREIEEILNKAYPTEIKALNEYSLYTSVHRSLQANLKALADNKDILKDEGVKTEAQEIEKELGILINRIENLKSRLGKTEEQKEEKAKIN